MKSVPYAANISMKNKSTLLTWDVDRLSLKTNFYPPIKSALITKYMKMKNYKKNYWENIKMMGLCICFTITV